MTRSPRSWQPSAAPRFHTAPDLAAPSLARPTAGMFSALRGAPMPWQVDLFTVACQLADDGYHLAYPYVVVKVPRRAGKSAAVLATLLQRSTVPSTRHWYTAQSRQDAATTYRDDWAPLLARPPWPRLVRLRRSNGSEAMTWRPSGSPVALFAPSATALHGQDADLVVVDEAWAFTADRGGELESGILPAQGTVARRRQTWVVSAGGTDESTWLARWVQLAEDGTPGVALVDYGATDDDDLDDPAVWARVHPAVGHTLDVDTLASIRDGMTADAFARAFLGVDVKRGGITPRIPVDAWRGCEDPDAAPAGRVAYGVEVSHDGTRCALAAAAVVAGRVVVEVIHTGDGIAWLPDVWRKVRSRHRGILYADALGPTASAVDLLSRSRLPVTLLTTTQYVTACAALLDDVVAGQLAHRGQPVLDAAAGIAQARAVGDRWVWERRGVDVSALVAVTTAAHGARRPVTAPSVTTAAG